MAIDQIPEQEGLGMSPHEGANHGAKFVGVAVVLAVLAVGEIYTLSRISSLSGTIETQQTRMRKELTSQLQDQLSDRLTAFENSNARQFETLRKELVTKTKGRGAGGGELRRTHAMITQLETAQKQQLEQLKQEIAQKADQQQVGALTQDVSATRTDLESTKKALDASRSDLGMARSEFGTLIARNHDEIEQLRKLGERDYFEFAVSRKQPQRVAGVDLALRKSEPKRHRFSIVLTADEMQIEKKDRTVNEPILFYVGGSKRYYELVVNKVESNQVKGYLSTPKGAVEKPSSSTGGR